MSSYDILVIILSVTLAIFLVLSIVATVLLIKLVKKISQATDSARQTIENVEAFTGTIKNVANGSIIGSALSSLWDKYGFKKAKKKGQ